LEIIYNIMLDQEGGKPDSTQGYIYRVRDTTPSISTLNFNQTFQFFIIKCIFDVEVTFIASFMFVIDVQADIFSMQHIRNIRVFKCWIASYTRLHSNYLI
jgi:hypothetical protein